MPKVKCDYVLLLSFLYIFSLNIMKTEYMQVLLGQNKTFKDFDSLSRSLSLDIMFAMIKAPHTIK